MDKQQLRAELSQFLRTRRAHLTLSQMGLPQRQRRRTPGLRREEVAELAGVSTAWYTYLKQGRDIHVSRSVLVSIANALQLSQDERTNSTFRQRFVDWETFAQEAISSFRATASQYLSDPRLGEFVDALSRVSPEFREAWPKRMCSEPAPMRVPSTTAGGSACTGDRQLPGQWRS